MNTKNDFKRGVELKKIVSVILAAIIMILPLTAGMSALSPTAFAATNQDFKCGYNATWDLDGDGVLTISGTGDMYDFVTVAIHHEKPWGLFSDEIYSIVIGEGITDIGRGAFSGCTNLKNVYLPASLESINEYAFYSCKNIESITVADDSVLMHIEDSSLTNTRWYTNQPDNNPVYLGRTLYKYKTSSSEPFSVAVRNGTYAISDKAFYNCSLTDISFPDSLASVGKDAFTGTEWLNGQPQGAVYAGNVFLKYNGSIPVSQSDLVLKDGTLGIAANAFVNSSRVIAVSVPQSVINIGSCAFSGCSNLGKVEFSENSNLRYIGDEAFRSCSDLTEMILPEKLESIGENVFTASGLSSLALHENVKSIGYRFAYESSLTRITVSEENMYYSSDSSGVLYNKDKSLLICAPSKAVIAEYTIDKNCKEIMSYAFSRVNVRKVAFNDALEIIGDRVFEYCYISSASIPDSVKKIGSCLFFSSRLTSIQLGSGIDTIPESAFALTGITEVTVPYGVKIIEKGAFINCFYLQKATLSKSVEEIGTNVFTGCSYLKVYCYKNSTAYKYAVDNSIPYILLDGTIDSNEIKNLILQAEGIDRSLYTTDSLAKLDDAINTVNLNAENLTQEKVNAWSAAIEKAIEELVYTDADYAEIDALREKTNSIDRTLYTAESLAELDKALAAVDYDLTIDKQAQVAEWAAAIETAIEKLEYLTADYSAVEAEILKAKELDRRYYSEISLIALDTAINAVDFSLDITAQATVDAYSKAISDAINALGYASIVLRHEPCGVIVSATTREIKPDTVLAVEEVDSSEHEGTNFAVGGSIRSLHFYDINLVYEAVVVQPDGTVTVKIKLADGVDPAKCKVYHVTEDIVNPLVRFASTIDGKYIVFETDHFSEFAVIEVETVIDGIEISEVPDKTVYGIGEQLDTAGLKVTAHFSDGTSREIADYTVGMVSLDSVGTKKVTVYYTFGSITKTASFDITVKADLCSADITENGKSVERVNKKIGIFSLYIRASIQLGSDVKNADGCILRWSSDNAKVLVDQNGRVTCKGLFGAKKANITVEVVDGGGNVVAKDTVFVIFYKLSFQLPNAVTQAVDVLKRIV